MDSTKLDLLTNATVVDDAIRFVSQKSKEKLKSSTSNEDHKESKEPDYDEDEAQLEEEQEEETGQINNNKSSFLGPSIAISNILEPHDVHHHKNPFKIK